VAWSENFRQEEVGMNVLRKVQSWLFGFPDNPVRTIFFTDTKDNHLIGCEIDVLRKKYLVCEVVHVTWLRRRGIKKYIPLYAVRGRLLNRNGGAKSECQVN
jgi:hypothetical protein